MSVVSIPSRKKTWQTGRERVSVLAALAIQKESVSRRLAALREERADQATGKPLSQEKAAAKVGVTMRQWQRWESGASVPYPRNLEAIAEAFEFDVAEFFDEPAAGTARTPSPFAEAPVWAQRLEEKIDASRQERAHVEADIKSLLRRQSALLAKIEALVLSESVRELLDAVQEESETVEQGRRALEEGDRASDRRRREAG